MSLQDLSRISQTQSLLTSVLLPPQSKPQSSHHHYHSSQLTSSPDPTHAPLQLCMSPKYFSNLHVPFIHLADKETCIDHSGQHPLTTLSSYSLKGIKN